MDIKKIFNIILLAISLSTIFITIISFLIFKFRQLVGASAAKNIYNLEGPYFRRFAPHLVRLNKEEEERQKNKRRMSPKTKTALCVFLVFSIVTTILFFEDYFIYRKELRDRITSAGEFRELIKQGLLRSYSLDINAVVPELRAVESPSMLRQIEYYKNTLNDQNICLVSTWRAKQFNSTNHVEAISKWKSFFKNMNVKYSNMDKIKDMDCLYVFPHILSFSNSEREMIRQISKKRSIIATGKFGSLNGVGDESDENIFFELFGVKQEVSDIKNLTQVVSGNNFLWEIPSGIMLNWAPLDPHASFSFTKDSVDIIESDYKAIPLKEVISGEKYYASRVVQKDKVLWTSLDPDNDVLYSDLIFSSFMMKVLKIKNVKINDYPGSIKTVNIFNTKIDDPLYDFDYVASEFVDREKPFVLYSSPNEFKGVGKYFTSKFNLEVGVANSESDRLLDLNLSSNFIFFEERRLGLEEIHRGIVGGVLPYDEKINSKFLNAIEQNRMRYVFGGQYLMSNYPVHIKNANFLYLPRVVPSIEQILSDKTLVNENDVIAAVASMKEDIEKVNGVFTFTFKNSLFKNPIAKRAIIHYLEEDTLPYTFFDITEWSRQKENVEITILEKSKNCFIKIKNTNKFPIENVVIQYETEGIVKHLPIAKIGVDEEEIICVNEE